MPRRSKKPMDLMVEYRNHWRGGPAYPRRFSSPGSGHRGGGAVRQACIKITARRVRADAEDIQVCRRLQLLRRQHHLAHLSADIVHMSRGSD